MMRIASVVGARPNFIKLAALHKAITSFSEHIIIHTGQHYDYELSEVFFKEFNLPQADFDLEVGSGPPGFQIGEMFKKLQEIFDQNNKFDAVLVYGDTNNLYTFIFTFSKPIGGILFGIAFLVIARSLRPGSIVRDYMIISGYGLMLMFISNQAVLLVNIFYPPFGLVTVSFMGLSSYMLLLGVYSSAISVSEDSKLRQSIREVALGEPRLLDSIGTAQMEQELQKKGPSSYKKNSGAYDRRNWNSIFLE
jgi:hypothetical protein